MKTWEPEQIFEKADFPRRKGEREDPAGNKAQPQREQSQKERPEAEQPKAEQPTAERIGSTVSRVIGPQAKRESGREAEAPPGADDRVVNLMRQSVLGSPEQTLRFLRRWYWEKWPPAEKIAGVSAVPPHDRLQIVFHLLEERVLRYLFEIMSPIERGQFNEITKKPWHFSTGTVHLVCREFLNGLRGARDG